MRPALACLPLAVLFIANAALTEAQTTDVPTTVAVASDPLPIMDLGKVELAPAQEGQAAPGALQYYDVGRNTSMTCSIPNSGTQPYVWMKNNADVSKVKEMTNRYKLENNNAKLVIARTSEDDYGNYSCKLGEETLYWQLNARLYTKLPSTDASVVEGQKLKLTCKMIGKPTVPVKWYYNVEHTSYDEDVVKAIQLGVQLTAGERITLEASDAGVEGGQLVIESAARADAGAYACVPDFEAGGVDGRRAQSPHIPAVSVLRVKDMYAALWPFLGICAEVLVLCAIILVYEKRRTKPELDDSDTDNHDQKKS